MLKLKLYWSGIFLALLLGTFSIEVGAQTQSVGVVSTVQPTGTTAANSTSLNVALTGAVQQINLTANSSQITILVPTGTSGIYWSLTNTVSTSSFFLPSGWAYTFQGLPSANKIFILGATASGNVSVFAH